MEQKVIRILLIDDDEIHNFITSRQIEMSGIPCEIASALSGEVALHYLQEKMENPELFPDLILVDINMPVMDGWEFLEHYVPISKAISKKVQLYMLSSSVNLEDKKRARSYPEVSDFISKPLSKEWMGQIYQKFMQSAED